MVQSRAFEWFKTDLLNRNGSKQSSRSYTVGADSTTLQSRVGIVEARCWLGRHLILKNDTLTVSQRTRDYLYLLHYCNTRPAALFIPHSCTLYTYVVLMPNTYQKLLFFWAETFPLLTHVFFVLCSRRLRPMGESIHDWFKIIGVFLQYQPLPKVCLVILQLLPLAI